jgi:hypothetical protein
LTLSPVAAWSLSISGIAVSRSEMRDLTRLPSSSRRMPRRYTPASLRSTKPLVLMAPRMRWAVEGWSPVSIASCFSGTGSACLASTSSSFIMRSMTWIEFLAGSGVDKSFCLGIFISKW